MIHIISEPNPGSLLLLQKTRFDAAWIEHEEYRNRTWTDAETPSEHVDANKRHRTNCSCSLQLQFYNLQATWYLYNAFLN